MFANSLSQYSLNQHSAVRADLGVVSNNAKTESSPGDYSPSDRALLLTAIAQEVDVRALTPSSSRQLQSSLEMFGLISSPEATQVINRMCICTNEQGTLNGVSYIQSERTTAQSFRADKALGQIEAIIQNLACAAPNG